MIPYTLLLEIERNLAIRALERIVRWKGPEYASYLFTDTGRQTPGSALNGGFNWASTGEGHNYWNDVVKRYSKPLSDMNILLNGHRYEVKEMEHTVMKAKNKLAKVWKL